MAAIAFTVDGLPIPQGSKTVGHTTGGTSFVREGNRAALMPWRSAISTRAREAMEGRAPFAGPVRLDVDFAFPRPKSHYRTGKRAGELKLSAPTWSTPRPDLDKLLRALGDALTGVVVRDDAQVVSVEASKRYGSPGAWVSVVEL